MNWQEHHPIYQEYPTLYLNVGNTRPGFVSCIKIDGGDGFYQVHATDGYSLDLMGHAETVAEAKDMAESFLSGNWDYSNRTLQLAESAA